MANAPARLEPAQQSEAAAPPVAAIAEATPQAPEPAPSRDGLLGVRPDELRRTAILAGYLFVASCVFVLGRTVRDAFFLSHYQERVGELLPFMFIAYGATSSFVAIFYARIAARVRRDRFVIGFSCISGIGYLLVRALVPSDPSWLYALLYVVAEIVGNLTLAQFWSVANELHDARSGKRLFGIIGVGRTIGLLACGLGAGSFVTEIGTENLLFVLAGLLALIAGIITLLERDYGLGHAPLARRVDDRGLAAIIAPLRSPYVRSLAVLLLVGFVVVNIGDFQFKAAARLVHPGRDELAHFMALFYATLGAIALVLQLFATRWTLGRFGVAGGMLALPLAYIAANIALLAAPSLTTATIVKIADNAFQFTIFEATLQLLYFPLPADTKESVRSFLEAIAKPLGYGLAGAAVLLLRLWHVPDSMPAIASQSWFVLPVAALWIAMIPKVRDRYLQALERSLARREADSSSALVSDPNTREVLLRTLSGASPRPAIYALEQLLIIDAVAAREALPTMAEAPHAAVRAAALRVARTLVARELIPVARRALDDPDDEVAATAAETFGALAGEDCMPVLVEHVQSARRKLQDAVVATLLRSGGLEGVLVAGRVVETWLASNSPSDRTRAAALLSRPGIPGLLRIVRRLLEDEDPGVRRAALAAAGAVGDPATCEPILAAMIDPASEGAAARALTRIGEAAIPWVDKALGSESTPRTVRLALPRVLAQMRTRAAYEALLHHIDSPDEWIRQKVLASASRTRAAGGFDALPESVAAPRMIREIENVTRLREQYVRARGFLSMVLLDRWMIERIRKGLVRVLRFGELAHPHAQVAAVRDAAFTSDPARRARAVEILENILALDLRRKFVSELDAYIALRARPLPPPGRSGGDEAGFVRQLADLAEPYARVMALDAAQFRGVPVPPERLRQLTQDGDPAVREMAALVIATFHPPHWRDILNELRGDEDLRVRTYAEYAFATGRTGMEPWDDMYTTLEKVLFLQRIPLFVDVPPEHLVSLARSAEVERRGPKTKVFSVGDPGDALYFVIAGRVRVGEGRPSVELGEGEVFGEMSVLDSSPRTEAAVVLEDATLLKIAQEDFYDVLHGTAELAEGVIHVLVRRLRATAASMPASEGVAREAGRPSSVPPVSQSETSLVD